MTGGTVTGKSGAALTDSSGATGNISGGTLTGTTSITLRGNWTISGGTFVLQGNGGPACVSISGGSTEVTGGDFDASAATQGMFGIMVSSGSATISGGRYKWNSMFDSMGAGYAMNATLADGKVLSDDKDSDGYYTIVDISEDFSEGTGTLTLSYTLNDEQKSESFDNPYALRTALGSLDGAATRIVVKLESDIQTAESWRIDRDITLDLNGYNYTSTNMLYAIEAESDITLTIQDGSKSQTGVLTGAAGVRAQAENGNTSIVVNSGEIKGGDGDSTAILAQKGNSITINGGKISGSIAAYGSMLEVVGGHIEHSRNQPVVNVQDGGSFVMTGGKVINSYERTTGVSTFYPAVTVEGADASSNVSVTGGSIFCTEGSALQIRTSGGGEAGEFKIGNDARLVSENGEGITYTYATTLQTGNGSILKISDNAVVCGGTYAIRMEKPNRGELYVQIDGGYFGYDDENLIPFADNSAYIIYPEGKVLNTTSVTEGTYAGYYALANTDDLIWTEGDQGQIVHQYQEFEDLDRLLDASKPIYENGNEGYQTYSQEVWEPFVTAYENALIVKNNKNANQNEIDFFLVKLATAKKNLDESLESELDVYNLADGTYEIDVYMWKTLVGDLSMADSTIERTAILTVKDGEANLTLEFHPMFASLTWGALEQFWVYNGESFEETRTNALTHSGESTYMTAASYDDYYTYNAVTGEITATGTGTNPGTVSIPLRYTGDKGNDNKVYCRVSVDAMNDLGVGEQNVILSLQYSTLKAVDVQPTLSVSADELSMMAGSEQTVTATLKGADGYAVTKWESSNPSVATVENGTIKAVSAGTATITVTASNGTDSISETIAVTVAPEGSEAVKVEKVETSGNTETATLSGSFLTSSGAEGIAVNGNTVTIDAKSDGSNITSSKVVIPQETAQALAGKTVVVETSTGSISLNSTLLAQIAGVENGVTLSISKASTPVGLGTFSSAYEISLVDANGDAVEFGEGQATVTVTSEETVNYAYCIENGSRTERVATSTSGNSVSFTVSHFSLWALSDREYETGGEAGTGFFLEDGNYYVDIALWKSDSNEASMGNVAFKNNDKALITVKDGKITRVQIGTNPVDIDPYHSAIISFELADGTEVSIDATGKLTTLPANKDYIYIKLVSFNLPDSAQPDISDAITYVPVNFYVPDTPMDAAVGETLTARLRFTWSTAVKTDDTSLQVDDTTAAGDSPITGEEIVDVSLVDEATGIKLETNSGILSDKAVLSVEKLTQGADYDIAMKAMNGVDGSWNLYKITALVDGVETAPLGSVVLYIPCGTEGMTLYRVNTDGTKTLVRGEVRDGYYVVRTTSLGLFAMVSEAAGTPGGTQDGNQNSNTNIPQTGDNSNVAVYALLALAAAGMMGITLVTRKRKAEEK